ncbi:cobaltochelatase subunit CobN [Paracoccus sp. (in: a-proteobacteria)]|uniref:cobaltochelatase subunit CobN n=1 Tax=Paracoccus sp. TaxID=267 RepID=UPI002B0039BB|nr:cobaltochelatase subunit CobN [Paracoccus sp. (in: a-proteobacteria)]
MALAVLPGDDRDDPRLAAHDTVSPELRAGLDACFRAGGAQNMEAMLRRLARDALGWPVQAPAPCPVPKLFAWDATGGITPLPKPVLEDPAGSTPAIHAAQPARIDALSPAQYGFSHSDTPQKDEPENSPPTAAHPATADLPAETQGQHPAPTPASQPTAPVVGMRENASISFAGTYSGPALKNAASEGASSGLESVAQGEIATALAQAPPAAHLQRARTSRHSEISAQASPVPAAQPPHALILAYRSAILAGETAPLEHLAQALEKQGLTPRILGLTSLKDEEVAQGLFAHLRTCPPDIIISTTAFSARQDESFVLDGADCPILQATPSGSTRAAWEASGRGLAAADLAMQVALPEFDGRLYGYPISFREEMEEDPMLAFTRRGQVPYLEGIEALARQAAGWVKLRRTSVQKRRIALVLPDYPARGGRAGFAVGLDTPASACHILDLLHAAGYDTPRDFDGQALMALLTATAFAPEARPNGAGEPHHFRATDTHPEASSHEVDTASGEEKLIPRDVGALVQFHKTAMPAATGFSITLEDYAAWLETLPEAPRTALLARHGAPADDPSCQSGAFHFPAMRAGNALIALQPDRSRGVDRKAIYHDPEELPTHAYLAFHLGLQQGCDALIHLGTHGTLEWLPGKAVALSPACWPRLVPGGLPVVYPFIVDDPGEAAPAKRRIGAVTLGHLTPMVGEAGLHGEAAALRALVEEFSAAQVLDPRRADLVAADILERAELSGLSDECGVTRDMSMSDALSALDAHLCDLGETSVRTGLHVFAAAPEGYEDCSIGEREGLLRALDGRFVPPGPAGNPIRGRRDMLPTGRNLATLDPRAIPTRAATLLGEKAAAEVLRRHLQDHGDWPRRIIMDLWASPTLRTGGEDIAHALALMGARARWDDCSTRVTGFEIIPAPRLDRTRIDVTLRISGAFRDTFPEQIALLDQAVHAIAALDEEAEWNALAEARRAGEPLQRIFGAAWGRYGAGVAGRALDGAWQGPESLGAAYLQESGVAFGGREGQGAADDSFAARIRTAQAFIHTTDVAERDILDGDSIADSFGGFAAAARALGASPALYSLDTSRPEQPRSRTLREDLARIVRARLTNPSWICAQLDHGWRGGAELAQGLDALCVFAATTNEVPPTAFDDIFSAWIEDSVVNARLHAANPLAEASIRSRLKDLRTRGLWNSRLNSVAMLDEVGE